MRYYFDMKEGEHMNIIIIGGSRGIGKAAAKELIRDGHRVLLTGRDETTLINTQKELQAGTLILPLDVTQPDSAEKLLEFTKRENFLAEGLILNAAKFPDQKTARSVIQPEPEELLSILDANLVSHYRLARTFLPQLPQYGRIIIIGSTAGIRSDKGGIYGISKWALRSYAYNLREEAKQYNIGVSLINPGGTFTETRKKEHDEDTSLLETSDLGVLIATQFRLSKQAVIEELSIRPITGDSY